MLKCTKNWLRKLMHSFELHSNKSACSKSGRLGMDQVLNTTLPIAPVELHKAKQSSPAGKEYFCFQISRRSSHAAQFVKPLILNKAIYSILSIDTF